MARIFGAVAGVNEGTVFMSREEVSVAGVHRPRMAGISGSANEGADSIVLNGGYEDDHDEGGLIVYTGHGKNDPVTKKQLADQEFVRGNAALALSADQGLPVRVVRGSKGDPAHSPSTGYRYDGLYYVADWWEDMGRSGFRVFRYKLVRDIGHGVEGMAPSAPPDDEQESRYTTVQRLVRNTAVAQWVKELHDFTCQVCGMRLATGSGPYAEGAHIRPHGQPHNGPDLASNVLCLCPNDHVLFDRGALTISDAFEVVESGSGDVVGRLSLRRQHEIDPRFLAYHRRHFGGVEN